MTDEELKAIEARLAASSPGRWSWNVSLKSKDMSLETTGNGHGLEKVMDFVRWGMGGAKARFQDREKGLMIDAEKFCAPVKGREHHEAWYQTITHPDAVFIAHAREDVADLLAEVRRLKKIYEYPLKVADIQNAEMPRDECTCTGKPCPIHGLLT